jgi:hypothetical protein
MLFRALSSSLLCVGTLAFVCHSASAAPAIPGIGVFSYGQFAADYRPYNLSLSPDGSLYAGSDNNAEAGMILTRIPSGGGAAVPITNERIYDPDGVLFDVAGSFSGVPGSLLVGCTNLVDFPGQIKVVKPDATVFLLVPPSSTLNNCDSMAFNSANSLYIHVNTNQTIVKFSGLVPQAVINLPGTGGVIAIDDLDRIWVSCGDGNLRRYGPNHALQATIAIGSASPGLGYSAGGVFTKGIYTVNRSTGALYRVTAADTLEQIGSGFPSTYSLAFDAAGNLYCANYDTGEVLRSGCVADLNADGLVDDADFSIFVVAYNTLDCADPTMPPLCPADLNRDAVVDDADFSIFAVAYDALICE